MTVSAVRSTVADDQKPSMVHNRAQSGPAVMGPCIALKCREYGFPKELLAGHSASLVVRMGMPALTQQHSAIRSLARNLRRGEASCPDCIGRLKAADRHGHVERPEAASGNA